MVMEKYFLQKMVISTSSFISRHSSVRFFWMIYLRNCHCFLSKTLFHLFEIIHGRLFVAFESLLKSKINTWKIFRVTYDNDYLMYWYETSLIKNKITDQIKTNKCHEDIFKGVLMQISNSLFLSSYKNYTLKIPHS